jgi:tryptophan halogenase
MKNIVIVGGGTAGWLTALYAKKIFPTDNIVLVESDSIGILGAGEGSTPKLIEFFDFLGIPVSDLIQNTKSTMKMGIKFTNWCGDNNFYYHGFEKIDGFFSNHNSGFDLSEYAKTDIPTKKFINAYKKEEIDSFTVKLSENNKLPFIQKLENNFYQNKIIDFEKHNNFSIHFDAKLLANYLSDLGVKREILKVNGIITKIINDENNNIKTIIIDDKESIDVDFIFDCSGFSKLITGKHYNSKWKSLSNLLPMKKAIPFFLDIDNKNIPPYTEAIAMKNGWIWKIPLQHRFGCGYVFDSNYINEEEAKKEIEEYLGFKPKYPREVKGSFVFDPGCFEEVWINNSLSVGLSSGFLEPLEATSIHQLILLLQRFFVNKQDMFTTNKKIKDIFNKKYVNETNGIANFIYFHYLTQRNDSLFWKEFKNKNKVPDSLKDILFLLQNSILFNLPLNETFESINYYSIAFGINFIPYKNIEKIYDDNLMFVYDEYNQKHKEVFDQIYDNFIDHSLFLKHLGGLND